MKTAIVTDSAAGLPAHLIRRDAIHLVPFWVQIGERSYPDDGTLSPDEFFRSLEHHPPGTVRTATPSVETFAALYRRLAEKAEAILSIHLTDKNSATCNLARLAAQEAPIPVHVINTRTTAMGEGFIVLEAIRSLRRGLPLQQVIERSRRAAEEAGLLALLPNIAYAVHGGRVASAARLLGNLLRVHVLLAVERDKLTIAGQARSRRAALTRLVRKMRQRWGERPVRLAVHYALDRAEGQALLDKLEAELHCVESHLLRIPPPLGVHAGPNALGVAYAPRLSE